MGDEDVCSQKSKCLPEITYWPKMATNEIFFGRLAAHLTYGSFHPAPNDVACQDIGMSDAHRFLGADGRLDMLHLWKDLTDGIWSW
ncbi:hypothetical protein OUZ56_023627 [Daphnia magna]|uniref:Uncharacterized protein n=1 Tax=Daphnia magna TaxID=35525 RepID=A0ABR0AZK6_9CRUS|nr:hypothetical protein OUZ56_023627 [Daphnia magna]